ncbi:MULTISPECIES: hypothetical protein [Streptococcus]|uniref:Uncharacterized protein n=1 Tax=Streptococcus caledonicus TaxID=2614158 RepID=A0ABW0UE88_9STRE|nr:hypothetical protein [Streptococcus sp. S784/96/1]
MSTTTTHHTILNQQKEKQASHKRNIHNNKSLHPTTKAQRACGYHNRGNR